MMKNWLAIAALFAMLMIGCNGSVVPTQVAGDHPGENDTASAVKILPESIRLDVSELAEQASAQEAPPLDGEQPPPEEPQKPQGPIEVANEETARTLAQLDEIMTRFAQINLLVPDDASVQVAGAITWETRVEGGIPGPGETHVPNPGSGEGEKRQIKVDFAAFDFDGDGQADGSGLPYVVPVALRVWVTDAEGVFKPAACGIISVLPSEDNPGAGELFTLSYARNGDGDIARIRWDQTNPAEKTLETWDEHPSGDAPQPQNPQNPPLPPEGENPPPQDPNGQSQPGSWGYSSFLVQHRQVGDLIEKTIKSSIDVQFVAGRYLETAPAGVFRSYDGNYDLIADNMPEVEYWMLLTRQPATAEDALNVSTDDFDLLPLPEAAWFASWPADFPEQPTF